MACYTKSHGLGFFRPAQFFLPSLTDPDELFKLVSDHSRELFDVQSTRAGRVFPGVVRVGGAVHALICTLWRTKQAALIPLKTMNIWLIIVSTVAMEVSDDSLACMLPEP